MLAGIRTRPDADFYCFFDDDVELRQGALQKLIGALGAFDDDSKTANSASGDKIRKADNVKIHKEDEIYRKADVR